MQAPVAVLLRARLQAALRSSCWLLPLASHKASLSQGKGGRPNWEGLGQKCSGKTRFGVSSPSAGLCSTCACVTVHMCIQEYVHLCILYHECVCLGASILCKCMLMCVWPSKLLCLGICTCAVCVCPCAHKQACVCAHTCLCI